MKNKMVSFRTVLIQVMITTFVCLVVNQLTGLNNKFALNAGICVAALIRLWRSYHQMRQGRA
jgi:hypothetical protein